MSIVRRKDAVLSRSFLLVLSSSLEPSSTYYYKIVSRDTAGNRSSGLVAWVGTAGSGGGGGGGGECIPGFPCSNAALEIPIAEPGSIDESLPLTGARKVGRS